MPELTYAIVTFGCRVNQADSQQIETDLRRAGGAAAQPEDADVIIVNTCSVTATADQGARQAIRRIARSNPTARIVATGCYATRASGDIESLTAGIRVVPNVRKEMLVDELVRDGGWTSAERFGGGDGPCGAVLEPGVGGRTAFTLRIQTGCDQTCAYCIIPSTRGHGTSLPPTEVIQAVLRALDAGYKEIVLTGVHLGSYGRDLRPARTLEYLLGCLAALHADALFRVSSLEPMDCTDGIVDLIAGSGSFAPHFHLPLQHASDKVLRAMRRPYSLDYFRGVVDRIRRLMPAASIGSDMIVGFPGETDKDFAANLDYLATAPLTHLHVFPYSDRPGTDATAMSEKVDGVAIRERAQHLRRIGHDLTLAFRQSQIGTIRRGLTIENGSTVVTDNFLKVRVPPGRKRNEWLKIRIAPGQGDDLAGEIVAEADATAQPPFAAPGSGAALRR